MNCAESYKNLPIDMSGSISKNRFRNELLWGLSLIYELYFDEKEFYIIFDNRCDIEQLDNDQFTFYQLKTFANNCYISTLTKKPKKKKESILSTLYALYDEDNTKELFVVSNSKLSIQDCANSGAEIIPFDTLSKSDQEKIKSHLFKQLGVTVDLTRVKYWNSEFCILSPQTLLKGKTNDFLLKKFKKLSMKPTYFYDYMASKIADLACYERKCLSLEEAKRYKGISKDEFELILENYRQNTDDIWEAYERLVEKYFITVKEQLDLKEAFSNMRKLECITLLNSSILAIEDYVSANLSVLKITPREFIEEVSTKAIFDSVLMEYDKKCVAIMYLIRKSEESKK